jgi:hypothetical protein
MSITLSPGLYLNSSNRSILSLVLQRYLSTPHLIAKRKYDLRVYVLILSIRPLSIYLYKEGIVRFSAHDYPIESLVRKNEKDKTNDTQTTDGDDSTTRKNDKNSSKFDLFAHLTNASINKYADLANNSTNSNDSQFPHSSKFSSSPSNNESKSRSQSPHSLSSSPPPSDSPNISLKWTHSQWRNYLLSMGYNYNYLMERIKFLVILTILPLINEGEQYNNSSNKCFELLGFDIMICTNERQFQHPYNVDREGKSDMNIDIKRVEKEDVNREKERIMKDMREKTRDKENDYMDEEDEEDEEDIKDREDDVCRDTIDTESHLSTPSSLLPSLSLSPHLIEVNLSPSISINGAVDSVVKIVSNCLSIYLSIYLSNFY